MAQPWTNREIETLRELAARRAPERLIAMRLRRSVKAVRGQAARQGLELEHAGRDHGDHPEAAREPVHLHGCPENLDRYV